MTSLTSRERQDRRYTNKEIDRPGVVYARGVGGGAALVNIVTTWR